MAPGRGFSLTSWRGLCQLVCQSRRRRWRLSRSPGEREQQPRWRWQFLRQRREPGPDRGLSVRQRVRRHRHPSSRARRDDAVCTGPRGDRRRAPPPRAPGHSVTAQSGNPSVARPRVGSRGRPGDRPIAVGRPTAIRPATVPGAVSNHEMASDPRIWPGWIGAKFRTKQVAIPGSRKRPIGGTDAPRRADRRDPCRPPPAPRRWRNGTSHRICLAGTCLASTDGDAVTLSGAPARGMVSPA